MITLQDDIVNIIDSLKELKTKLDFMEELKKFNNANQYRTKLQNDIEQLRKIEHIIDVKEKIKELEEYLLLIPVLEETKANNKKDEVILRAIEFIDTLGQSEIETFDDYMKDMSEDEAYSDLTFEYFENGDIKKIITSSGLEFVDKPKRMTKAERLEKLDEADSNRDLDKDQQKIDILKQEVIAEKTELETSNDNKVELFEIDNHNAFEDLKENPTTVEDDDFFIEDREYIDSDEEILPDFNEVFENEENKKLDEKMGELEELIVDTTSN